MMKDLVSVIIPVFNGSKYIKEAISSVIAQTYDEFEILVIDDGSSDDTAEIIKNYMSLDSRIRYIYKVNGGVSSARNRGLEEARGEYISFLDYDDSYEPEFIQKCHQKIVEQQAEYCVCWAKINEFDKIKYYKPIKTKYELIDFMKFKVKIRINGILLQRSFIEKFEILFNEKMSQGEDHYFLYMVTAVGRSSYVPEVLCTYNFIEGSLSDRRAAPEGIRNEKRVFSPEIEGFFKKFKHNLKTDFDTIYSETKKVLGSWAVRDYWRHIYFEGALPQEQIEKYQFRMSWFKPEFTLKGMALLFMKVMFKSPDFMKKGLSRLFKGIGLTGY